MTWIGAAAAAGAAAALCSNTLPTFASRTGSGTYSGKPNADAAAPSFLPLEGRQTGACGCSREALMLRCVLVLPLLLALPAK